MDYGAIDLHKRRSHIRIIDAAAQVQWAGRIDTTPLAFAAVFAGRPPVRVLVESSTESEWVARVIEALGHEVIVADPNYAAMYGSRTRAVKTDERDVRALAEACRTGVYRAAHRASAAARQLRQTLTVRRHLVRTRTALINVVRALLRQDGLRVPSGAVERLEARLTRVTLPAALTAALAPLRVTIAHLTAQVAMLDQQCTHQAATDPIATRLMTVPGVGPIVALTFRAVLDDPARFGGEAGRASAFLGVVPSEHSSADRHHRGHITKTGPRALRALLIQAGWTIWRGTHADGTALRTWAQAIAARRGRRIAVVGLARRLTRILFAIWRDATTYREPAPRVVPVTAR